MVFRGTRIIESAAMVEGPFLDFSACRSPGRARRRYDRGIRGRVKACWRPRTDALTIDGGRTLIMHPITAAAARAEIERFAQDWREASGPLNPLKFGGF